MKRPRPSTVDGSTGKSWTHKEYEYAAGKNIPVLGFIRDEKFITQDKTEKDTENQKRLEAFKQELKDKHHVVWWSDAKDLTRKVVESLRNHIDDDEDSERARPGWYRGDTPGFSPNVADELARLSAENNALWNQVEALNASKKAAFELLDQKGVPLATYERSRPRLV